MRKWAGRDIGYTYIVHDYYNQTALVLKKGAGAWSANLGVFDAVSGEQSAMISVKGALIGRMQTHWQERDASQPSMLTKGNVLRRQ